MEVAFGNGTTTPDDKGAWSPFKGGKEFTFTKPAHIDKLVVLELSQPAFALRPHDVLLPVRRVEAMEHGLRLFIGGERYRRFYEWRKEAAEARKVASLNV